MALYFVNSAIVTFATIAFTVIFSLMATYALSRMEWRGRKLVNSIFMLGLTVPIHAANLPIFIILRELKRQTPTGTHNSLHRICIGDGDYDLSKFHWKYSTWTEESACIDGCGVYGIFFRIVLPLMKPALSTIGIFTFLQAWNELMFAVIFISDSKYRTLSVGIQALSGATRPNGGRSVLLLSSPRSRHSSFIVLWAKKYKKV